MAGCRRAATVAAALSFTFVQAALGQTLTVGDPLEDYLRLLQISGRADVGSFTVRPSADINPDRISFPAIHPWSAYVAAHDRDPSSSGGLSWTLQSPELRAFANSRFPVGSNDGVVWQGRGATSALDLGGTVRWGALTVEARPTLLFTQNADQDLAPVSSVGAPIYAYPLRRIDWPQQFGPEPFWTLDPGQSEARLATLGLAVGFGTKNLLWGPAIRNPIIMSNNAPGIPHGFLATDEKVSVGIGELEARWIWGRLQQSDWFAPPAPSDERFITGIVATFSPGFLEGLSVGLTRVFYVLVQDEGVPVADYFAVFQGVRKKKLVSSENPTGDDEHDQLLSVFGRWVLAESGFEVYWEWARNDHSWELRDFLLEPEHSQAYTLGLQKAAYLAPDRLLRLGFELTHLESDPTFQVRGRGSYYAHHVVAQGYTHKGQIIGAGIGPGGNAQSIAADLYAPWGRIGTWLERQVHDNDAYYQVATDPGSTFSTPYCCHDVSLHWGTHALWLKGPFDLGAGMIITREFNRWFYGLDLWNLNLSLSAKWHPG